MSQANREKVTRLMNAVAAGTSDQTSSALDMAGWDGVKFYTAFGTITSGAVTHVEVHQSSDDGSADAYTALAGSKITVADDDDNQVTVHDIFRPRERWLKVVVDRGTQNAVIDGVIAIQYAHKGKFATSDDSTTVVARELHTSPAEGTA